MRKRDRKIDSVAVPGAYTFTQYLTILNVMNKQLAHVKKLTPLLSHTHAIDEHRCPEHSRADLIGQEVLPLLQTYLGICQEKGWKI